MTHLATWFVTSLVMSLMMTSVVMTSKTVVLKDIKQQIEKTRPDIKRIADHILSGPGRHETFSRLATLGDKFGHRLIGSAALDQATDYIVANMKAEGFDSVVKEPVTAPKWVRGNEWAELVSPRNKRLPMLGLGSSVGTNGTVLQAEAIVVRSFDQLRSLPDASVAGKIVVFNQGWLGNYRTTNAYRQYGASEASKKGAIAALIHSVTDFSLATPHTGQQNYEKGVVKIPVACITMEDAEMLQRMYDRGDNVTIRMMMEAENPGDVTIYNIVAELTGSEFPDQTVILGGHVDTWDVGDGSVDDGGGLMISWEALSVLKRLNLRPRRTLRVVLWTAEEQGAVGAQQYYEAHKDEVNNISLAMESDYGTFSPRGIGFNGNLSALAIMKEVMSLLGAYNASSIGYGQGWSPDIVSWIIAGVPAATLKTDDEKYFYFHHSAGDTMTVQNADDLDLYTLVWVTASYVVASLDDLLPRHDDFVSHAASTSASRLASLLAAIFVTSLVTWRRHSL